MTPQVVWFPDDGLPVVVEGDPECNADPCPLHLICHCRCRCGIGEDCSDCKGLSD